MHTDTIVNDYYLILGRGGRIYADICSLNIKYNLSDGSVYDHYFSLLHSRLDTRTCQKYRLLNRSIAKAVGS